MYDFNILQILNEVLLRSILCSSTQLYTYLVLSDTQFQPNIHTPLPSTMMKDMNTYMTL